MWAALAGATMGDAAAAATTTSTTITSNKWAAKIVGPTKNEGRQGFSPRDREDRNLFFEYF